MPGTLLEARTAEVMAAGGPTSTSEDLSSERPNEADTDRRDTSEEQRHHALGLRRRLHQLGLVPHAEVVFLLRLQLVRLPQYGGHLLDGRVGVLAHRRRRRGEPGGLLLLELVRRGGGGLLGVAERDLRTIIAAQPDNAAALNALGYTLADQTDRLDEAEALIRQAYILQPDEAAIVDSMGWVAFRQGRLEQATQFLARAWTMDRNPEIAAHLGEVLWTGGKREEAIRILREGAEIDAENPVLVETLDRLGITL